MPTLDAHVDGLLREMQAETVIGLVADGLNAFMLRALTARTAKRTLDLQYYAWHDDVTGRLMAGEVLAAADRGVAVRLLLDDTSVLGEDEALSALEDHENIQLRLFNVGRWRLLGRVGFAFELALGGWHLNHRMHNKAWVADNRFALLGGRNIGDAYFDASGEFNFHDLDVAIVGGDADRATHVFEAYWNSRLSRPVRIFRRARRHAGELPLLRRRLEDTAASPEARPYCERLDGGSSGLDGLRETLEAMAVNDVAILYDKPEKAANGKTGSAVARALRQMMQQARAEILLISPYFVPGEKGLAQLLALVRRGVKISVITNTLAATDVAAVHGGYARYRRRMLEAGIELRELRRSGHENAGLFGSKGASLHTKAILIDGTLVGVGSFNLDPRSLNLNTEAGVFAQHPELGRRLRQEFDRLADPTRSFKVELEDGHMVWRHEVDGREETVRHEPDAPLGRRLIAQIVRWLPLESQL
ncbi:phospholipase D family protein [Oceanibaculum pacificum]|uniref:Phospholipase D n=1 Tax=Oceanibaculum pacificum TaxID=580166 RepID=A0A154VQ74_9PROT|nr:phospholipase D family protein [Oceanibaculum pacificum]KZD03453.1 cardiolipin synthase [Oceanibaculum pacificum]